MDRASHYLESYQGGGYVVSRRSDIRSTGAPGAHSVQPSFLVHSLYSLCRPWEALAIFSSLDCRVELALALILRTSRSRGVQPLWL